MPDVPPQEIRRLSFDQLSAPLQAALGPRVERLGYLGEFFRCAGHQPDVLLAFHAMTDALKAALPERLTEVVALTVAQVMDNAYERNQHERLSERLGFGRNWIEAVLALEPAGGGDLTEAERAVQALALALLRRNGQAQGELSATVERVGDAQAIALLFLVGRYVSHALIVNALALEPPVPSIFGAPPQSEVRPPSTA